MKENKLVKMAIMFVGTGKKKRYEVTNKIRNYPKGMRDDAINFLVNGSYIFIQEGSRSGKGRTPAYISLTEKGKKKLYEYSNEPDHISVWTS